MLSARPAKAPGLLETLRERLCQHFQPGFQAEGIPAPAGLAVGKQQSRRLQRVLAAAEMALTGDLWLRSLERDETASSGEARQRNTWGWDGHHGWWKTPSYNQVQLSALQQLSSSAGTPPHPWSHHASMLAGTSRRQVHVPGGRATTSKHR